MQGPKRIFFALYSEVCQEKQTVHISTNTYVIPRNKVSLATTKIYIYIWTKCSDEIAPGTVYRLHRIAWSLTTMPKVISKTLSEQPPFMHIHAHLINVLQNKFTVRKY